MDKEITNEQAVNEALRDNGPPDWKKSCYNLRQVARRLACKIDTLEEATAVNDIEGLDAPDRDTRDLFTRLADIDDLIKSGQSPGIQPPEPGPGGETKVIPMRIIKLRGHYKDGALGEREIEVSDEYAEELFDAIQLGVGVTLSTMAHISDSRDMWLKRIFTVDEIIIEPLRKGATDGKAK